MKNYFTFKELTTTADKTIDNSANQEVIDNLTILRDNLLNPLRELYGKPIYINSGYRCPELNKKVGGSKTSDHLYGYAADITTKDKSENIKLFNLIINNLDFKQCISEYNGSWIHVSYQTGKNRKEALTFDGTHYKKVSVSKSE